MFWKFDWGSHNFESYFVTWVLSCEMQALLLFFLSCGDLPVIENLVVTPKDIFNSDFLWFHQHYTSTCL